MVAGGLLKSFLCRRMRWGSRTAYLEREEAFREEAETPTSPAGGEGRGGAQSPGRRERGKEREPVCRSLGLFTGPFEMRRFLIQGPRSKFC